MEDQQAPQFIVIDDVPMNNQICKVYIKAVLPAADIVTFTDPVEGLEYMLENYSEPHHSRKTVLFLDISMPVLTGWDVLDHFAAFPRVVQEQFIIYVHSSSIDVNDIRRATAHPLVSGFIAKPLMLPQLREVLEGIF